MDLVQLRWSISALARAASIISLLPEFRPARSGRPVEVREEGKRLGDAQSDEPRRSRPSLPSAQLPILDARLGDSRGPTYRWTFEAGPQLVRGGWALAGCGRLSWLWCLGGRPHTMENQILDLHLFFLFFF